MGAFLLYMALRGRVWDAELRPFFILGKGGKDILTIIEHLPYASPDLPEIHVELLDFDNLKEESAKALERGEQLLKLAEQAHKHIF